MRLPLVAILLLAGCTGPRVIIVPETEPVQLAEDVKAFVFVEGADGQRVRSGNRVVLHSGQWVATVPPEDK